MSKISELLSFKGNRYTGNPKLLMFAALGFTVSAYFFNKSIYKPWARRQKLDEAEKYANFVYQQTEKKPKNE